METFYKENENLKYSLNEVFTRKIEDKHLLTTRHGGWILLDEDEIEDFEERNFEKGGDLFNKLKEVGILLTEDNKQEILKDIRRKHSNLLLPTTYHVIPIADSCNLNCKYCHPDAKPGKGLMDRDMAEKVLDFIFSIPNLEKKSLKIVLTGGEPLLNYDVLRYIINESNERVQDRKIKLQLSIVSNFTQMDDEIASELTGYSNLDFCTSLDGPKELHNKHRPFSSGKGSYEEVVYWIKRLREKYDTQSAAIPVVTKLSLEYGAKAFVDAYLEAGINKVFFKPYRPQGRARESSDLKMSSEEFYKFYKEGVEYCLQLRKDGVPIVERTTAELVSNFLFPSGTSMCRNRPCGAGTTMLSYDKAGDVYACDSLRSIEEYKLGTVDDEYAEIRSNALPIVSNTSDTIPECSNCAYNAFCGTCPGVAYGDYDDMTPKPPIDFDCNWNKLALDLIMKKIANGEEKILKKWARENAGLVKPKVLQTLA